MSRRIDDRYDDYKDRQAEISRKRSAEGRDVGGIPPIEDVRRRSRCRKSLRLFCETYNPEAFSLAWSTDQLRSLARLEEAVTEGALYAFAEPRGSGKTTRVRMAALWAWSYALSRYVFVIGANAGKAQDTIDAIKMYARFLPLYAADFPEISWPAQCLGGIANRAGGQLCGGEPTMIEWGKDRIVAPTVPCPPNWPKSWPKRADGKAPSSGAVVGGSGLTGDGIRGSLLTLTTGESVRPDLVLLDDPQTAESSASPAQNATRIQLVSQDVLGMAGPGKAISAVMPCTVIEPGDMADTLLDRAKHPLWRGERTRLLASMPTDLAAWDDYFEVYRRCALLEPPDFTEANDLYSARRAELDAGAEASWPARKLPGEVSAVQHAMHLYCRDPRGFWAEYQNAPLASDGGDAAALDPAFVAGKVSNLPRLAVPRECTRVTAFVDVGTSVLWYLVAAWDERFGGAVIDYGAYPDQRRAYFTAGDVRPALGDLPGYAGGGQDAAIYGGLTALASRVLGAVYRQEETGHEFRVERCLVDANWGPGTDLVYDFCRRSPYAGVLLPSHGKFIGASGNPMSTWAPKPGERAGWGWRLAPATTARGRHVTFDTNQWKTFAAERIRTPGGAAGCVRLFAPDVPGRHQMAGDHFAAEYPVAVSARGGARVVEEWKDRPGRDNHLWDAWVGCCVAASVQGLRWSAAAAAGEPARPATPRQKLKLSDIQKRRAAERVAAGR